jgi:hypothetical protein
MKLHRILIVVAALMLPAAAGPTTQSGTRRASCVLDIWSSLDFRQVLYVGHPTFAYDDLRTALCRELGPAAHEMLGIAPEVLQEYVTVEPTPSTEWPNNQLVGAGSSQRSRLTLTLALDDKAQPAAREFMGKMIDALPGVIDRMQRGDLLNQMDDVMRSRAELADQEQRARQWRDLLRTMGIDGRTTTDIEALARSLDEQNQQLNLDVAALSAQSEILAETVDRINADATRKAADDPIATELETIVTVKEKKLEFLQAQYKLGTASPSDLSDAEAGAAEARVQLLERREAVARAAGGDALADFQKQLVLVEVNLAQDKARLGAIKKQSESLNTALDFAQDNQATGQTNAHGYTGRTSDTSDTKVEDIQRQLEAIPKPAVRVVSEEFSSRS